MIAEQFAGLLELPDDAKLQLAGELFADVIGDDDEINPALTALIEARLAEYREHPEQVSTWDAVKARLLKKEA
jgi:putative addiction module component (TIGR02574 family)